jgi:hypothetical protein
MPSSHPAAHSFPSKELRFIHPVFSKVAIVTTTITTTTTIKTVITINYTMQKRETNSKILSDIFWSCETKLRYSD